MQLYFLLFGIFQVLYAQNTTTFTLTSRSSTTTTMSQQASSSPTDIARPSVNSSSISIGDGSFQDRATLCTSSSTKLVNDYTNCFSSFPVYAPSTQIADSSALKFVLCICKTSWQAGSPEQITSSIPVCPAIPGVSKGGQAAIAADCATINQNSTFALPRKIIQNFGLRTILNNKIYYVPLAGLPPGVLSSAVSMKSIISFMLSMALLNLMIVA